MFSVLIWLSNLISSIGALNWGLSVFFNFDIVLYVAQFIRVKNVSQILYGVVALSGIFSLLSLFIAS